MPAPYPSIAPNYGAVDQTGGFHRYCYVLELLTADKLSSEIAARLEDAIGIIISELRQVEQHDIVRPNRFTNELRKALHIS